MFISSIRPPTNGQSKSAVEKPPLAGQMLKFGMKPLYSMSMEGSLMRTRRPAIYTYWIQKNTYGNDSSTWKDRQVGSISGSLRKECANT